MRSFLGARFLDNGEDAKLEQFTFGKTLIDQVFPVTLFGAGNLPVVGRVDNRALRNDPTPGRNQSDICTSPEGDLRET